jgi:hypothetical protein
VVDDVDRTVMTLGVMSLNVPSEVVVEEEVVVVVVACA